MAALEKGITRNGTGYSGKTWNILGQVYFPKAVSDSTFAFETNSDPGQFVPVHIHPTQEEFISNSMAFGCRPTLETWYACREAFRTVISTNRTSLPAPCSGYHLPGSWRRCSTNSITLRTWLK